MPTRDPGVAELSRAIIDEILIALGLPAHGWLRNIFEPILWPPAERFSGLAARFDQAVAQSGLCAAARAILPEFVTGFEAIGAEQMSAECLSPQLMHTIVEMARVVLSNAYPAE